MNLMGYIKRLLHSILELILNNEMYLMVSYLRERHDLENYKNNIDFTNNISDINKAFKAKNSFKGKIGIFDIENNKINHRLNFYKIEGGILKEIF